MYDNQSREAAVAAKESRFLVALNEQQRAAAEHCSGPLLVIAGAGTGKTKTLAARVARLIQNGVEGGRILLLTFTRRAASEMIRRAGQVVGKSVSDQVWGGTFHSVAHRLIRVYNQPLGLGQSFTVMDQGDAEDLFQLVRTDLGLHKSKSRFPKKSTLLAIYSTCVNTGELLEDVLERRFPWCQSEFDGIKQIFEAYTDRKSQRNLLDYDDLLLFWDQALDIPAVAESLARRFDHVLVDEYQDTNALQASILSKLWTLMKPDDSGSASTRSIMVVGDDAQSIYAFRGATIDNILRFPSRFAGCTTVKLEQNYRSVMPILQAANAVMADAKQRHTKNLWSERESDQKPLMVTCPDELAQCQYVVDRILEHREEGVPLTRQAVLFRTGHYADTVEVELAKRNVPFVKWGGLRFLEAAHIKDLLAFLRILENPQDELSWMRVLQLLDGIGPGRSRQALDHLPSVQDAASMLESWSVPASAQKQVRELAELLEELAADLPLATQIEQIRRFYTPILEERFDQAEMRSRDLDQLELLAQNAKTRASFLADLTLDPPVSTGDLAGQPLLDEEYLVLSTIHSAKGCEWDVVYIIHAADGVMPSDMATGADELEEERRLLYVAMTRARNRLYITYPFRYYHRKHAFGDSYSTAQLSRFLKPEIFPLFERVGTAREEPQAEAVSTSPVADNVRQRLRRLWR